MNFVACLAVLFLYLPLASMHSSSRSCSYRQRGRYVKIPDLKSLLTLDEFDQYVVGIVQYELTIGTPNPVPFVLFRNFNLYYTKRAERQYVRWSSGNPVTDVTQCETEERDLHLVNEQCDRAAFYDATTRRYVVFRSLCPSKYIIRFECSPVNFGEFKKCSLDKTFAAVLVPGDTETSPDDIPWYTIVQDMYKATGIKFGSESLQWFHTYGTTENCPVE